MSAAQSPVASRQLPAGHFCRATVSVLCAMCGAELEEFTHQSPERLYICAGCAEKLGVR